VSWSRPFDDPIPTPKCKPLVTLKDGAAYIMALPKPVAKAEHWQIAIHALRELAGDCATSQARQGL
jgi:hypothetical protein